MDPESLKESATKEEPDSGVDNTSDSGHSGEEDQLALHSDYEELSSDNESNSNRKVSPNTEISFAEAKAAENSSQNLKKNELNIRIEPSPHESLIGEEYREVIEFYKDLADSQCETVDFSIRSSAKRPEWFDEEKFKRGQKFAREHLFCINFAEMLTLFILFAQRASLGPLIFTGRSDSPFTAFKRYLSTNVKLMSWYEDDLWNEPDSFGSKNLNAVRGMHKNVYQRMTNSSPEDLAKKTTLGDPNTTAIWCPLRDLLVQDFRESLPLPLKELLEYGYNFPRKKVWVNQGDMSLTQFGFVGLAVTYPKQFGIYSASDEDLEGFLHLWRSIGYLLGIKDKYNFCNTNLESVRLRTKFYLETLAKPLFRDATCDWEHMCRCLTAGISYYLPLINFESSLLYLCHVLEIDTPRLKKQMSFRAYFIFLLHRVTIYLMRFQWVLKFLNSRLYEVMRKVQNTSPEVLEKWENREFPYMKQPGKCPIRGGYSVSPDV